MSQQTILLVEDNTHILDAFTLLLEDSGYRVRAATTGSQAIQSVREASPDLVLLDLGLPDMDGLEVVHAIKRDPRSARVPIVVLTGHALETDREACLAAGCAGYLTKPINSTQLLSVLPGFLAA
ncbi:MAG: response regulator [Gemmatimonadetes bacterium]|nr:response regulator [Gemmatimonadota bacterium]